MTPGASRTICAAFGRVPLVIIDKVDATSSSKALPPTFSSNWCRSNTARSSVIVSSNKAFSRWGEVFGDDTVASAMIDRLVHHAEVVNLKGDCHWLKGRDLGRVPIFSDER